jgi:hypothetical protein
MIIACLPCYSAQVGIAKVLKSPCGVSESFARSLAHLEIKRFGVRRSSSCSQRVFKTIKR